jgi:hypothetical protein
MPDIEDTLICATGRNICCSWAMRAKKILVLHTVTNYCGTNLIFYNINDLILDIRGSIFLLASNTFRCFFDI